MDEIRDIADGVLISIEQATLTDAEAINLPTENNLALILQSLVIVLNNRKDSGVAIKRLNQYAKTKGIDLNATPVYDSNIFIGGVL